MSETTSESPFIRILRAGILLGSLVVIPAIAVCWNVLPKPKFDFDITKSIAWKTETPSPKTKKIQPEVVPSDPFEPASIPVQAPAPALSAGSAKVADQFSTPSTAFPLREEPSIAAGNQVWENTPPPTSNTLFGADANAVSRPEPRFSGIGMTSTDPNVVSLSARPELNPSISHPFQAPPLPVAMKPSETNPIKAMNWTGDDTTRLSPIPTEFEPPKLEQPFHNGDAAEAGLPQTVPPLRVAPGDSPQKSFPALEAELQGLGANYYRLEKWGSRGELFRFSCYVASPEPYAYQKYFQAVDPSEIRVMERVIEEIRVWRKK